jgi:2-amino-4-hydroxy-6-hydroxymethyldihydropteridine diphosphokinase
MSKGDQGHGVSITSIAYLSLGSNLGDRQANLNRAITGLAKLGWVRLVSSFYETEPVEFTPQPWFLNCAVELMTELSPDQLLRQTLRIEQRMGRIRDQEKGPRSIDIDILLFDDLQIDSKSLTIPHPALHRRRFVLEPLTEIAPEARHPVLKKTISQLRSELPAGQAVRRLTEQ